MGAINTLKKHKPMIWFENTDKNVSKEMKDSMNIDFELPSVPDFLSKIGYRFYNLDSCNTLAIFDENT
jgi:hypothetical protein